MNAAVEVVDRVGLQHTHAPVMALIEAVLRTEAVAGAVTVALVGEAEMVELNGRFRGLPESTDVLSFRYADAEEEWLDGPVAEPGGGAIAEEDRPAPDLGEVVVCPAVVDRYAREEGADFGGRLAWALVHGVLHLVGYDHEKDHGEMRRRERVLLEELAPLVQAFSSSKDSLQNEAPPQGTSWADARKQGA
ncbi:MAG: rRNA maturation RNase YbeY [Actinomycetia bacterium]|nr:rRNA maturation RNase YbeY [Actinomycetes bacterium]